MFRLTAVELESGSVRVSWSTVGGKSYTVQTNAPGSGGGFTFSDCSQAVTVSGAGESTTNFLDSGARSNAAARYYRVRLGP